MLCSIVLAAMLTQAPVAPHKLRWEPRADIPITGVLVTGWLLSELAFKNQLSPDKCRWCATNGFDTAVRVAFNPSLQPSANGIHPADVASTLFAFIGVPLAMVGIDAILAWKAGVFMESFWID